MWCVLQVRGNQELNVRDELLKMGYKALVPQENRIIRTGGNWTNRLYTLFPNYVFLETNYDADDFYRISKIPNFQKFLGDKKEPSHLSFLEAEWIKLLSNNNQPLEATQVIVNENEEVEILKGVLLNFKSRVKSFNKRQRKAVFEITVCNEIKEITLSIEVIEDKTTKKAKQSE